MKRFLGAVLAGSFFLTAGSAFAAPPPRREALRHARLEQRIERKQAVKHELRRERKERRLTVAERARLERARRLHRAKAF